MSRNFQKRFEDEVTKIGISTIANTLGIARNTVYNWIGKANVPLNMLMALNGLGVDIIYVISGNKEPKASNPSVLEAHRQHEFAQAVKMSNAEIMGNLDIRVDGKLPNVGNLDKKEVAEIAENSNNIEQNQIDGKATESNGKLPTLGHLKESGKFPTVGNLEKNAHIHGGGELQAAETVAGYKQLRADQIALLDNLDHCPKDVQEVIKQLIMVSSKVDVL